MEIDKHEPGMFSWADLGTTDPEGAKSFYTELLGLEAMDIPMGEGMSYSMLNKGGRSSCALYRMPPEMEKMTGGHPFWVSYFTVESADEIAERIKEVGGTVVNGPFDVFTSGRMVVAQDPTGAMFSCWEPKDHAGAGVFGEPGALAWNELYTHDTGTAARFYGDLFGWSASDAVGGDGGEYTVFQLGGRPAAGMMAIKPEWGETSPDRTGRSTSRWPTWTRRWTRSRHRGDPGPGSRSSPGDGSAGSRQVLLFVQDPQGAYFSIMQMEREVSR